MAGAPVGRIRTALNIESVARCVAATTGHRAASIVESRPALADLNTSRRVKYFRVSKPAGPIFTREAKMSTATNDSLRPASCASSSKVAATSALSQPSQKKSACDSPVADETMRLECGDACRNQVAGLCRCFVSRIE